jgi:type VI secretion system protein ImpH
MTTAPVLPTPVGAKTHYFELMRAIEREWGARPTDSATDDARRVPPAFLRIEQPPLMGFAATEVESVGWEASLDANGQALLRVRQRGFGLFAPYGPLPIHFTEHAFNERLFHKSAAFEAFVNGLVERLAWTYYCAWSSMHPVLGWERPRNAFRDRLDSLSRSDRYSLHQERSTYAEAALRCRQSYPGLYFGGMRSLGVLQGMLSRHFRHMVRVLPRARKWLSAPQGRQRANRIGHWRLGSRMLDAQQHVHIEVGPMAASDYAQWRRNGPALKALLAIVVDYTDGRVSPLVDVLVKTSVDQAARAGAWRLGVGGWLSPTGRTERQRVFESSLEH